VYTSWSRDSVYKSQNKEKTLNLDNLITFDSLFGFSLSILQLMISSQLMTKHQISMLSLLTYGKSSILVFGSLKRQGEFL